MKKVFAALLIISMLMTFPTAVLAAEDGSPTYHSSLITHWDFEGDSTTVYQDKATGGVSSDVLTVNGTDIEVKDGVAFIPNTKGTYLTAAGGEGTDLNDLKDTTVVFKVALVNHEEGRGGVAAFASKGEAFAYVLQNEDANNTVTRYVRVNGDNNTAQSEGVPTMNEFRIFTISFDYVEKSGDDKAVLKVNYYMSTKEVPESGADFVRLMDEQVIEVTNEEAPVVQSTADFILGRRQDHLSKDRKLLTYFDDVKVYSEVLTTDQIAADCPAETSYSLGGDAPVSDGVGTAAYQVGDEYVAFVQADDSKYVSIDSGNYWKLADQEGATNGKALYCETKASNAAGDGITLTFFVPKEGDYTIWARAYYPTHSNNSMYYSIDQYGSRIWDFPDEDDTAKCYNSWQYFYLTQRVTGTYTDTAKYGAWTIENGDWRHSPNTLHLSEGQHTIKLTGREAGMYIDEFVITSYSIEEYDPNAYEGNTFVLETCKFCGSNWKHYYSDVFAQTAVTAQTHFTTVLHTDAVAWTIPEITPDTPNTPAEPTPSKPSTSGSSGANQEKETANDTATETVAPTDGQESGCGSSVALSAIAVTSVFGAACCLLKRKKEI